MENEEILERRCKSPSKI